MAPRYAHEPDHYTIKDTFKIGALILGAVVRGRPTAEIDRKIAKIQADAIEREAAERANQ